MKVIKQQFPFEFNIYISGEHSVYDTTQYSSPV